MNPTMATPLIVLHEISQFFQRRLHSFLIKLHEIHCAISSGNRTPDPNVDALYIFCVALVLLFFSHPAQGSHFRSNRTTVRHITPQHSADGNDNAYIEQTAASGECSRKSINLSEKIYIMRFFSCVVFVYNGRRSPRTVQAANHRRKEGDRKNIEKTSSAALPSQTLYYRRPFGGRLEGGERTQPAIGLSTGVVAKIEVTADDGGEKKNHNTNFTCCN